MTIKEESAHIPVPTHEKLFFVANSMGMKDVELFSSNTSNKKTVYVKKDDGARGPLDLIEDPREYMAVADEFKISFVWDGPLENIIATMPTKDGCRTGCGKSYGEATLNCLYDYFSRQKKHD